MNDDGFFVALSNTIKGTNECIAQKNCPYYAEFGCCAYDNDDECPLGIYDDMDNDDIKKAYERGEY